jgi:invasion protein IalB
MGSLSQRKKKIGALALILALVLGALFVKSCLAEKSQKQDKQPAASAAPKSSGAAAPEIAETNWELRCTDEKGVQTKDKTASSKCETYKVLVLGTSHTRVAEIAASIPDPKDPEAARAAIVLPLGIRLDQGVALKIDDNKPFGFNLLYCTNEGCFSLINMNKDLVEQMKKGDSVHFIFRAMNGQNVNLSFKLAGFGKALKQTM